jgi:hypothetical protein
LRNRGTETHDAHGVGFLAANMTGRSHHVRATVTGQARHRRLPRDGDGPSSVAAPARLRRQVAISHRALEGDREP